MPVSTTSPRRVSVLGATGSVGTAALRVIADSGGRLAVAAVAARRDVAGLAKVARASGAALAVVADESRFADLRAALTGTGIEADAGASGMTRAASAGTDSVLVALPGVAALRWALVAARAGVGLALANKECLASAGALVMRTVQAHGAFLVPVDSEHNALWHLLRAHGREGLVCATITASGGPFHDADVARMARATPREACAHPVWRMGPKISVDSATLMNKGLELIEASTLFALEPSRLEAVVHRQGAVHALTSYASGAVYAHCARADMRLVVASALFAPDLPPPAPADLALDIAAQGAWTFAPIDTERFPAFALARAALEAGGDAPARLNAANEVAVAAFLEGQIGFLDIASVVEATLASSPLGSAATSFDAAMAIDADARRVALGCADARHRVAV